MIDEAKARYWGIHIGGGGKFAEHAKKGNYIAIGWEKLGKLDWLEKEPDADKAKREFTKEYKRVYKGTEVKIGLGLGQVLKFVREIKEGDIVVIPDMARGRAIIGRVISHYEYRESWEDDCPYQHRKKVEWIKEIKRDAIPEKLKTSLGALLTVFSLNRRRQEIMQLIGNGTPGTETEVTGDELARVIISRLFNLDPKTFEQFITDLFALVGFEATTTKYTQDKGIDVIGTLSPEGLANVTLKAQVKRVSRRISNKEVLMLRGALGVDEHGVFITTGRFTKQAVTEAEAEGKKPIAIIDGQMLFDLILTHYDELDKKYKEVLQLEKRKVPLREQFYTMITKS